MGFEYGVTAIGKLTRLMLGYAGEGGTRNIRIDVSEWLEQFPGAMIVIQMVRPQDRYKYFVSYTKENGVLTWTVGHGEVKYEGKGLAQITLYNPDTMQEYKSRVVETIVARSLEEFNSMLLEEDDPAQKWVNQVLDAAKRAEDAVKQRLPYIGSNGNWWIWDVKTDAYVDSGVGATPAVAMKPMIFTGAVNATYDGSQEIVIEIPAGGTVEPEEPEVEPLVLPAYWKEHVDSRILNVNAAMAKAGSNRNAFMFYSDAHWTYGYQMAPTLLDYVTRHTEVDKVIFGGDIMDEEEDISYLETWRTQLAGLPCHHSVAGNHDDGNAIDGRWDAETVYERLLAPEVTADVVRGADLYYHIDVTAEKTRYIYIDSATSYGAIAWNDQQKAWLKATLLSTPAGWHIVPIAHLWANPDYSSDVPTAGTLGDSANFMLALFDSYNSREGEYADCTARVEYCIGGHTHRDDEFYSPKGIPVILVETDSMYVRSGLECIGGSITESSVSAIIADYMNGYVNVIRFGRGESRRVMLDGTGSAITSDYDRVPLTGNFTNALDIAETQATNAYYNNGNGYENAVRIKSDNTDKPASWDSTGYIPATPGATVRMYNVEFTRPADELRGTSRAAVFLYNAAKQPIVSGGTNACIYFYRGTVMDAELGAVTNSSGDFVQFTIPDGWYSNLGYIRLTASDIRGDSIITINQDIPFMDVPVEDADYLLEAPTGDFTNMLDVAEEADSTAVYNNGNGYKNRIRLYSDNAEETTASGWDTTGFIAAAPGSVIRMHGMTFTKPEAEAGATPRSAVFMFDANKNPILGDVGNAAKIHFYNGTEADAKLEAVMNEDGDFTKFKLPAGWYPTLGYIRITAGDITGASIITVDEEINI